MNKKGAPNKLKQIQQSRAFELEDEQTREVNKLNPTQQSPAFERFLPRHTRTGSFLKTGNPSVVERRLETGENLWIKAVARRTGRARESREKEKTVRDEAQDECKCRPQKVTRILFYFGFSL